MKKAVLFLLVLPLFISLQTAYAQSVKRLSADSILKVNGEVYFKFGMMPAIPLDTLTQVISIDNVKDGEVFAYANRNEYSRFLGFHISHTILPSPGSLLTDAELNMGNWQVNQDNMTIWNFYPTYDQYVSIMSGFATNYPTICRLDTIGKTIQGRLLLALKISDSVNYDRGVPEVFFSSSIHGDETTGYVLMLHLIDTLLNSYGVSTRLSNMVNNKAIYICPLANPDGTYHSPSAVRGNANGIDLNRNFPDPAGGNYPVNSGSWNPWQPETMAFMKYAGYNHFNLAMNFHGGAEVMNYPWDCWSRLTADDSWWQYVSREYVDTVHLYGPAGYFDDLNNGITNGYAWYSILGGRQDHHNYFKYTREVTLEISATKYPAANTLMNYWNWNKRSFFNYIEQSGYGINGKVYDSITNAPIAAKVYISSFDIDSSHVYSSLPSGWYFRMIDAGTKNLTFSAPGYYSRTISSVTSARKSVTRLNVKLRPIDANFPRSLYAIAINANLIRLFWLKNASENPVLIAFNTTNTFGSPVNGTIYSAGMPIPGGGLVLYNGPNTSFDHTMLNPGTTYYYRAWSVLTGNSYSTSSATTATTKCGTCGSYPITESFSTSINNYQLPECWSQEASGTNAVYSWRRNNSNSAGGTAWEMRLASQSVNPGTTRMKTFFFNTIGVPLLTLSFKQRMSGNGTGETLKIQSSSDGITWNDEAWTMSSSNSTVTTSVSINISNNLNSPTTMIAFVASGDLSKVTYWYIDDVSIKAPGYWVGGTLAAPYDWNTATNWGDGLVPTSLVNAYIPYRPYLPVVNLDPSTPGQCLNLTIEKDSKVTINSGKKLIVNGDLILKAP